MAQQKSFWKKYEFLIIAIVTLLLIYFIVVFSQKINFLLGNELVVYLMPQQKSFYMHYGNISTAKFDVSIDNVAYCKAECSYSFTDRSRNKVIDKGSFNIEKKQHFIKDYNLSVKRLGSGQDIYGFDVRCRSLRSLLCLTKGNEKLRSSLITINYDLTETEKELKNILKKNVTLLLETLADVDVLNQKLNQKYFELGFSINLLNLSKQKIDINDAYDKLRISIENLRSLWSVEDYSRLNQLFNEGFFENLSNIKNLILILDNEINDAAELHNRLLSKLNLLSNNLNELNNFISILEDNATINEFFTAISDFNEIASSLINNTFENYDTITNEIKNLTEQQNSIIEESKSPAAILLFNLEYFLKFENDLLCNLNLSCKENMSVASVIKNSEYFIENYPDLNPIKQNCESLIVLNQSYSKIRNKTVEFIENNNLSFPLNNDFLTSLSRFKNNKIIEINNSYFESFEEIKLENKTNQEVMDIASLFVPKDKINITLLNYNESANISLYLLSKITPSNATLEILDECLKFNNPKIKIGNFNFVPINTDVNYSIISKIESNLSDNPPICCVFDECKPCCNDDSCENDPKTFPIIFLHGHSIVKDNSPEFSLDSFNKLQSKLQEDGYLNAGIVSLYSKNEPLQRGIWGLSGKPVTVKVSYYYDAFRKDDKYIVVPTKSENIDTYALRLQDVIEMIKERTSKPKVNIIAFSMGGLVARRYTQIFGEEDIDKLVTIATPNKGISGAISDYCGVIGESRECQDMNENSLFIQKLNDPLKQIRKVKLYAIIGQGCQMKHGDGDGIVLAENAKIDNAKIFFVNGTCSLFEEILHREILDVEEYPETYRIVTEILKE